MRVGLSKFRTRDSRGMLLNTPIPMKPHVGSVQVTPTQGNVSMLAQVVPNLEVEYKNQKDTELQEIKNPNKCPNKTDVIVGVTSDHTKTGVLMDTRYFVCVGANGEITSKIPVTPKQSGKIAKYLRKTNK